MARPTSTPTTCCAALGEALDQAEPTEARAVLLVGRPGRFSAGFDLATMTAGPEPMRALVGAGAGSSPACCWSRCPWWPPAPVTPWRPGPWCSWPRIVASARPVTSRSAQRGAIGMALPVWAVELARYRMPPSELDRTILGETSSPEEACAAGFLDRSSLPTSCSPWPRRRPPGSPPSSSGAVAGTKTRARAEVARAHARGSRRGPGRTAPARPPALATPWLPGRPRPKKARGPEDLKRRKTHSARRPRGSGRRPGPRRARGPRPGRPGRGRR